AAGDHAGPEGGAGVHDAVEVDGADPAPVVDRHVGKAAGHPDPGVVHEDVDRAGAPGQGGQSGGVGHVAGLGPARPAEIVARAGGVSKGLVFHYFPTTRDLQVAVLRAATAELLADLDVGDGLPPDERLKAGLEAFVRYIEQQPASYQAVVRRAGSDEQLLAVFEDTRAAVVEIVAGALGVAELPAGLRMAVRGWIAMVEECVLHWLDGRPVPREELVEFLRRVALTMLPDALRLGA